MLIDLALHRTKGIIVINRPCRSLVALKPQWTLTKSEIRTYRQSRDSFDFECYFALDIDKGNKKKFFPAKK